MASDVMLALYLMERSGEAIAVIAGAVETDARRRALHMRERQWRAFLDKRKRVEVARRIIAAKLRTLALQPADARGFRAELAEVKRLDDILTCEARAGAEP
jgi:CRISPR/Cas system-associated endonuclease Cas1